MSRNKQKYHDHCRNQRFFLFDQIRIKIKEKRQHTRHKGTGKISLTKHQTHVIRQKEITNADHDKEKPLLTIGDQTKSDITNRKNDHKEQIVR